ncbi:DUF1611 domain-containing protein [Pseudoalteromonas umbrosa]|uniref:DUF1611 domain-containing protein n=1 Tax=Pseudoalteromonas umbrosa TaxID=3048489 RepID=UPI0024C2888C|nr:DUF1611 domain-containing protein [Pseudoalteromonas sp. B95]MDK1290625.1 DUF1611 domain-containing protein [Pseudoalteromonas sp. B95]
MKIKGRRVVLFCEGLFSPTTSKVATSFIRYCENDCVAVIDSTKAGQDVSDVLGYGAGIPIVKDIKSAIEIASPDLFMVGIGLFSNELPSHFRGTVNTALEAGLDVVSGLHYLLGDDAEFAALAKQHNCQIWDTKKPPQNLRTSANRVAQCDSFVIHTVGSDCRVGKKTTSFEIVKEAAELGIQAAVAATGQSGLCIAGQGVAVDAVPADFIAGVSEQLVLDTAPGNQWVVVEGQGSLTHPAYSGVTLGLLHGAMPEALVLCHQANLEHHKNWPQVPVQPLPKLIDLYEKMGSFMRPCKVVAISVNCEGLSKDEAGAYLQSIERETGLPATDVIKFGASKLVDALIRFAEG